MTRTLIVLAATAALAVSAAPAFAGTSTMPVPPRAQSYTLSNTMISGYSARPAPDKATARHLRRNVTDGTSNTVLFGVRRASFSIDIGTSEAAHSGTAKPVPNGIIAVLIGL